MAMRVPACRQLVIAWIAVLSILNGTNGEAATFDVAIDTTLLSGAPSVLAFDFINGGLPSNTVTLSNLTSNGTQVSAVSSGDVSGSGPWTFSDSAFFNELLVTFDPTGTALSFSFTTTDN